MNYKQILTVIATMGVPLFLPQPEASMTRSTRPAASSTLFKKGSETFELKDTAGKTPEFRVLNDSPTKRALAVAIATAINTQDQVEPKIPVNDYIDLRLETITLTPVKGASDRLSLDLKVSGHEIPFEQTLSRADLLAGKEISLKFPKRERTVSLFSLESNGQLKLRYDAKKTQLVISDAVAKMDFESPMIGEGSEAIRYSGLGVRKAL